MPAGARDAGVSDSVLVRAKSRRGNRSVGECLAHLALVNWRAPLTHLSAFLLWCVSLS